jgi:hypothetical protein
MGELKNQDTTISSTEKSKIRGNPNLKKGAKNPYYEKGKGTETKPQEQKNNMAEEGEGVKEQSQGGGNEVVGEKKIIPDDLFSDTIPDKEVIPLDDQMKTKDYASHGGDPTKTTPNSNASGGGGGSNNPPNTNTVSTGDAGGSGQTNSNTTTSPVVEGVKTPEQVKTEAEQFVKLLLRGYDKLHAVGRWAGKMDPNDLMLLHQKRKIDLDYNLPLGTGVIGLRKFFSDYNLQIDEDIVVTDDFKRDITPPLERIAIKRGWGLGDEGTVMLLLAEDLGTKVALLYGLKKTCNMVLDSCMQIMKSQQEAANPKKETKTDANDDFKTADSWREADNTKDSGIEDAKEV